METTHLFKVGDIIKSKTTFERYVVTAINCYSSGIYFRGINRKGGDQGGSLLGSNHFDEYEVIGHTNLVKQLFDRLEDCYWDDYENRYGKARRDEIEHDINVGRYS